MEQAVEELSGYFRSIRVDVIRHVLEVSCGGNIELARDALRSLSYTQIQQIKKNLEESGSTGPTPLSPLQQDKCRQFQSFASCSQEVAVLNLKKADWVVEHAINRFFETGGVSSEPETTQTSESTTESSVGESQEPSSGNEPEKKTVPPMRLEYEGLYDVRNREFLVLESVLYDVKVTDYAAEKTCIQRFVNKKHEPIEVVYVFPMLDDVSSVFSVEVEILDLETKEKSIHTAEIQRNKKSNEEYDDRISQGDLVVLLEKREKQRQLAQLVLGNIHPKHEVTVSIKSVEELEIEDYDDDLQFEEEEEEEEGEEDDEDDGSGGSDSSSEPKMLMKFRIPSIFPLVEENMANEGNDNSVDQIEMSVKTALAVKNVTVKCDVTLFGGEIVNVNTPGILVRREQKGKSRMLVFTKRAIAMTKDVVVEILVKSFPPASCLVQPIPEGIVENVKAVGMVSFIPKNKVVAEEDQEIFTEFIIVVDCSGSMAGSRIQYAREAMRCFVQSLNPEDKVKLNIVRFGTLFKQLWNEPRELTEENFHEVLDYINDTKSNMGRTDILTPLLKVLKTDVTLSYSRQVFFLTDGEDKNTLRITQEVRRNAKSTRIFTLGIGKEINMFLIKETSRCSNGKYGFIKNLKQIQSKVMEQLMYAAQPSVYDLECAWPEEKFGKVESVVKEGLSSWVYLNERKILYFFLDKIPGPEEEGNSSLTITFVFGPAQLRNTVTVPIRIIPADSTEVPPLLIGRLAATKRIDELQKYGKDKTKDLEQIEKLGLGFSMLTSETSFFLKAKQDNPIESNLEMVNIPTIPYITKPPERPKIHIPYHNNRYTKRERELGRFRRSGYEQLPHAGHLRYNQMIMDNEMMLSRYHPDQKGLGVGNHFEKAVQDQLKKINVSSLDEDGDDDNDDKKKEDEDVKKGKEGGDKTNETTNIPQQQRPIAKLSFQETCKAQLEMERRVNLERRKKKKEIQQGQSRKRQRMGTPKPSFQEHARVQYEYEQQLRKRQNENYSVRNESDALHLYHQRRHQNYHGDGRVPRPSPHNHHHHHHNNNHRNKDGNKEQEEERLLNGEAKNKKKNEDSEEEVEGEVDEDDDTPHDLPALEPADDYDRRMYGEGDRMIAGQHHVGGPDSPGDLGIGDMFYDDDDEEDERDNRDDYFWDSRNRPDFFDRDVAGKRRRRAGRDGRDGRGRMNDEKAKKKKEKEMSIKEKIESIEGGILNKILFTQGLGGLWEYDEFFLVELLQLPFGLVSEMNPLGPKKEKKMIMKKKKDEEGEGTTEEDEGLTEEEKEWLSLWTSALTLVTLMRYYKNSMLIWKLIAKKAERCLKKKTDLKKITKTAEEFVREYRKR